jgi:hypothetical protein
MGVASLEELGFSGVSSAREGVFLCGRSVTIGVGLGSIVTGGRTSGGGVGVGAGAGAGSTDIDACGTVTGSGREELDVEGVGMDDFAGMICRCTCGQQRPWKAYPAFIESVQQSSVSIHRNTDQILRRRYKQLTLNLQLPHIPNPYLPIGQPISNFLYPRINCTTFPFRLHWSEPTGLGKPAPSLFSSRNPVNFSPFALHAQMRNSPFCCGQEASNDISSAEDLCTLPSFSV